MISKADSVVSTMFPVSSPASATRIELIKTNDDLSLTGWSSDVPQLESPIMTARHDVVGIREKLGCKHLATVTSQRMLQHNITSVPLSSNHPGYNKTRCRESKENRPPWYLMHSWNKKNLRHIKITALNAQLHYYEYKLKCVRIIKFAKK